LEADQPTDLVDHLAEDEVSVLRAAPLDGRHQQITEAVDSVRQLVQQVEAAGQHGVREGVQLLGVQRLRLHEALQAASLLLLRPLPGSPVILLSPPGRLLWEGGRNRRGGKTQVRYKVCSSCS